MSVSKWKWTEACDSKPCCGNCDECSEDEEMTDITYCGKPDCDHTECRRHSDNIPPDAKFDGHISFGAFTECEFWESED